MKIRKPFDVIIVDYHMPGIDGIETIRIIRDKLKLGPDIQPVILLHSSSDDVEIHEECKKLGVRFNLTKPIKQQELLNFLRCIRNQPPEVVPGKKLVPLSLTIGIAQGIAPVILIAEDVALNRLLAKTLIKQMIPNATVLEAKSGKEAFDMAVQVFPDLVFMDVQMPEISGIEATVEIRKFEQDKNTRIPIVALTAGAIKGEKERCMEAGMDDFLTKPVDRDALYKMLEKHLTV